MNKILVFDIWADYGHFRVPYTTSSPITYPVPPKTAIYGIIGAILGYAKRIDDKNVYLKYFQDEKWKVAISIKNPIKTVYIPENFIDTKRAKLFGRMRKDKPSRTQINLEFLKDPFYRLYITSSDTYGLTELKSYLAEHKTVFTLSLGLSECLSNFKYIGFFEYEEMNTDEDYVEICSIIPFENLLNSNQINFLEKSSKFLKIHLPLEMKPDRELIKSGYFLIEANGNTIKYKKGKFFHVKELNENILLF